MKHIIVVLVAILICFTAYSQKIIEKTIKVDQQTEVFLDFEFADDINVKGWNKNEIYIKVSVNINNNEDNDAFTLDIKKHSNSIDLISDIERMKEISRNKVTIHKSKDGKRTISYTDSFSMDMDIYFDVYVPKDMMLNAETISGNYVLTALEGEIDLESISGFIDITIDKNNKASVKTSTISGGVYTDHSIKVKTNQKNKRLHIVAGRSPEFDINGGGKSIKLKTISGDIYIRK